MKYLVSHQGQELGPFTLEEIVAQVLRRELDLFDYIFDSKKSDWVLLMEHPDFAQKLKSNKPPAPRAQSPKLQDEPGQLTTTSAQTSPHAVSEWFVLKGENRFGPFSYTDIVKMLQQKVVFPFDFLWHVGMKDWARVAEISEFTPQQIRQLMGTKNQPEVFIQRRFKREKYQGRVLIHDNMTLWRGEGFEISRGGVGIHMKNALVIPGQQLFVHFTNHGEWPAFNAVCEVVSKKFVNDQSPMEYGLRFLSLSQDVQDYLETKSDHLTKKEAA